MSSTTKTPKLNLSQFQGTDIPDWITDYSNDMKKIDDKFVENEDSILTSMEEVIAATDPTMPVGAGALQEMDKSLTIDNLSLNCAISENVIYAKKAGNLVRIKHNGTITGTLTANTAVTLCTIPSEFRPKTTVTKNIIYRGSSDISYLGYGVLEISGSGTVILKPYNVPSTGGVLTFDETFVIS